MVGKILAKQYVILEEVGPDGDGIRFVAYNMVSLARVRLRVEIEEDGKLTGERFTLLSDDEPDIESRPARAAANKPKPKKGKPTADVSDTMETPAQPVQEKAVRVQKLRTDRGLALVGATIEEAMKPPAPRAQEPDASGKSGDDAEPVIPLGSPKLVPLATPRPVPSAPAEEPPPPPPEEGGPQVEAAAPPATEEPPPPPLEGNGQAASASSPLIPGAAPPRPAVAPPAPVSRPATPAYGTAQLAPVEPVAPAAPQPLVTPAHGTAQPPQPLVTPAYGTPQPPQPLVTPAHGTPQPPQPATPAQGTEQPPAPPEQAAPAPPTLAQALEKALSKGGQRKDATQPLDLSMLEEVPEPAPLVIEPSKPGKGRPETRKIEAAWFAMGEDIEEQEGVDPASTMEHVLQQDQLWQSASDLSPDEYRKFSLDLSPPALPGQQPLGRVPTGPPLPGGPSITAVSGEIMTPLPSHVPAPEVPAQLVTVTPEVVTQQPAPVEPAPQLQQVPASAPAQPAPQLQPVPTPAPVPPAPAPVAPVMEPPQAPVEPATPPEPQPVPQPEPAAELPVPAPEPPAEATPPEAPAAVEPPPAPEPAPAPAAPEPQPAAAPPAPEPRPSVADTAPDLVPAPPAAELAAAESAAPAPAPEPPAPEPPAPEPPAPKPAALFPEQPVVATLAPAVHDSQEVIAADIAGNDLVRKARHLGQTIRRTAAYQWLTGSRWGMFILGAMAGLFFATVLFSIFSGGTPEPVKAPAASDSVEETTVSAATNSDESGNDDTEPEAPAPAPAAEEKKTPAAEEPKPAPASAAAGEEKPEFTDGPVFPDTPPVTPDNPAPAKTEEPAKAEPAKVAPAKVAPAKVAPAKVAQAKPRPRKRRKSRRLSAAKKRRLAVRYLHAARKAYRARKYKTAARLSARALRYNSRNRQAALLHSRAKQRAKHW